MVQHPFAPRKCLIFIKTGGALIHQAIMSSCGNHGRRAGLLEAVKLERCCAATLIELFLRIHSNDTSTGLAKHAGESAMRGRSAGRACTVLLKLHFRRWQRMTQQRG